MSKNTGKPYERLTQQVFQAILNDEGGADTVTVEHDVDVDGLKTKHQIDVLWRFRNAGVEHTVLVQCKDHADNVSQGDLLTFKAVLDDIPAQPRGVFVTRTGYQTGALDVARAAGIVPYVLRPPTEEDWKGRIRNINTAMRIFSPEFRAHELLVDEVWYSAELERLGLPVTHRTSIGSCHGDTVLEDEDGNERMTVNQFLNSLAPNGTSEYEWTPIKHVFGNPTFLAVDDDTNFRRVKLLGWNVEIRVTKGEPERVIAIRGDDLVGHILQNEVDGTRTTLDKAAQVLRRDIPKKKPTSGT